jgi:MFS transporter, FHS family, glucose/mannose:H+ symporter
MGAASTERHIKLTRLAQIVSCPWPLALAQWSSLMSVQAVALNGATRQRFLFALLCAGFVLTGIEITLIGPMLPVFIARWGLSDARAGFLGSWQFGFSLGGVWLSSLLTHYFGNKTCLVLGYLVMAAGLATANAATIHVAFFALAALGIGYGLVVPVTNVAVAEIGGARSASLVSLVNFAWGIGSFASSPLVLISLKYAFLSKTLYLCAGFGCVLALTFLLPEFSENKEVAPAPTPATGASAEGESGAAAGGAKIGLLTTVVLATLFFLYVAVETSFGSWAAAHVRRLSNSGIGISTLAGMFFYGGLTVGRALAPLILSRVREFRLVIGALLVVIAGGAVFVFAPNQLIAFVSVTIAGLGCAAIFPIYVAWFSHWYGSQVARLRGVMFSMSSIGSSAGPGLVGLVSEHAGGLRAGLMVPLACAVAMLFLLQLVRRRASA